VATPFAVVRFFARRLFEIVRCVDPLIYALIWIGIVGLGPFAGVLAIMTAELGFFGKLFSDEMETAAVRNVQAVGATGAPRLLVIRFGLLPQAFPVMLGNVLYQFESNVRSATIIGVVGAGGVGSYFSELIKENEWQAVCFLTLVVWMAVTLMESLSAWLRETGNFRL
jgi:phosphonate transport system permease protein